MIESLELKNLTTNVSLLFDRVGRTNYVIDDDGLFIEPVSASHSLSSNINQVGSDIVVTRLEERSVIITGYVWDYDLNGIEAAKKTLSKLVNPMNYIEVILGDYYLKGKPEESVNFSTNWRENNEILCKFMISLNCNYPMFKAYSQQQKLLAETAPKFRFPLVFLPTVGIIMGVNVFLRLLLIDNPGDIETGLVITIKAIGEVINPVISNINENESLTILKTMTTGETIVINTKALERNVEGGFGDDLVKYFEYWDYNNVWLQMPVGPSLIGFSAEGESYKYLKVTIEFGEELFSLGAM
ncbi:phage tail domain-containing protein [Clostridium sp.]|uniref:phage tail domain-containing protein n=1 Tax=Clostridium sp. TaxID=1506 RepID=UPI001A46126F|nr:phage tail domain-containing protein [Clostridium sp.]MBK5234051.1 phage tail family protein [Clostridium sp.]